MCRETTAREFTLSIYQPFHLATWWSSGSFFSLLRVTTEWFIAHRVRSTCCLLLLMAMELKQSLSPEFMNLWMMHNTVLLECDVLEFCEYIASFGELHHPVDVLGCRMSSDGTTDVIFGVHDDDALRFSVIHHAIPNVIEFDM